MDFKEFRERYQYDTVKDLLGIGGFGKVYRARDQVMDRWVALKIFSRDVPGQYDLLSEIKRAIDLNHPNICRYHHAELIRGTDALGEAQQIQVGIMELIEGGTIDQYLRRNPETKRKLLWEVLNGLSYLHHHRPSIIHRDMKPSNVLVHVEDGIPIAKITDFGISKSSGTSGAWASTRAVGTYAYMAPEQFNPARFALDGKIQCNVDLWSFGVMLIELLTGKLPFGGADPNDSTGQVMESIFRGISAEALSGLEEPYRNVLMRCLVQDAAKRAQNATELMALLNGTTVAAEEPRIPTVIDGGSDWTRPATEDIARGQLAGHLSTQVDGVGWPYNLSKSSEPDGEQSIAPPKLLVKEPNERLSRLRVGLLAAGMGLVIVCGLVLMWGHFGRQPQIHTPLTTVEEPAPPQAPAPVNGSVGRMGHSSPRPPAPSATQAISKVSPPSRSTSVTSSSISGNEKVVAPTAPRQSTSAASLKPQAPPPEPAPADLGRQADALFNAKNYAQSVPLYAKACNLGDGEACTQLGYQYLNGLAVMPDRQKAASLFLLACNAKFALGCHNLGWAYETGTGVPRDEARAASLYTQACNANYGQACYNLAEQYTVGRGIPMNFQQGRIFYSKACDDKYWSGCDELGRLYALGFGGPQDLQEARSAYARACDARDWTGCIKLGLQLWDGKGGQKDQPGALALYTKACDAGSAEGCGWEGNAYDSGGDGIAKDHEKAKALWQMSCNLGSEGGCINLRNHP